MKKTLAAFALATVAILGSSAPALAAPTNPLANQASYWESPGVTCTKVEINENIKTFTLSDPQSGTEYVTLILKAGSGELANTVTRHPSPGWRTATRPARTSATPSPAWVRPSSSPQTTDRHRLGRSRFASCGLRAAPGPLYALWDN
jgi:hypothetical protein